MSWQKIEGKEIHRRADGAQVLAIVGGGWAAGLPGGRSGIPIVIRDARGKQIRKFPSAEAAMAWLDAEHPEKVKEKIDG